MPVQTLTRSMDDEQDEAVISEGESSAARDERAVLTVRPIGVVHSPLRDRLQAPRQPAASAIEGRIELFAESGIEHAVEDLETFRFIWVLFWFNRNQGFRPKVLPPRSAKRRGLFATRSPYRPNPIGLSAVELVAVEGRVLHVRHVDMLDGTPVLDLKPYLAYTDAIPDAANGWLDGATGPVDPLPAYAVEFTELAEEQLAFLAAHGVSIRDAVRDVLRLGPQPHPYRRIKREGTGFVLAHKEWRLAFSAAAHTIRVTHVRSGYRASELFASDAPELALHRAFSDHFGANGLRGERR